MFFIIILENQIVSPLLLKTAIDLKLPIYYDTDGRHPVIRDEDKVLTNSESCLTVLENEAPSHPFTTASKLVKNKAGFRQFLSSVYPDYYFRLVSLEDLLQLNKDEIPFPVVIKPNKGYSSIGVYIIETEHEWDQAVESLYADLLLTKNTYSNTVVNGEEIIIEEWIDGDEYAVDCYVTPSGKPVVLNILKRTFINNRDTSDRIYFTSKQVINEIKEEIEIFLHMLNERMDVKNFPFHLEVRKSRKGIRAIELNPLRFAGAGTTDLSYHAYGVNGAQYYFQEKEPEWEQITAQKGNEVYGFFCAEIPLHISKHFVESIDHEGLMNKFSQVLEYRAIQASNDRTFAVIFFQTSVMDELQALLHLDLSTFIRLKQTEETAV